jgi:hypothetical protein
MAVSAGILLALAFGDLFPEGLAAAGDQAVVRLFVAAFGLLYLMEALTDAHTHHGTDLPPPRLDRHGHHARMALMRPSGD